MSRAKRPSWRWYLAYTRWVVACVLDRITPAGTSKFFGVLAIVLAVNLVSTYDEAFPATAESQQKAIVWWVAQLIIMAVSAIISAALAPKQKPPEPVKAQAPQVEEGRGIKILFGTVWVEDEDILAFKEVGTKKIKAKGGKKG